ncbi:MAG: hypothetical protein JRI39_00530 [Deltaproteobacteria bacterium]|nr:hypothetical protein [Deltaproteobacteria bacterium]
MGLESATTPNDFNTDWPLATDPRTQGDDHIRLIKKALTQLDQLPVYADNASAKSGGLTDGDLYRTSSGQLMVVYT